ncbi:MAG: protein-glutamate O-methyltransferase CheR [Pseudomonadota bacterium]
MKARDLLQRETGLDLTAQAAERAVAERMAQLDQTDAAAYLRNIAPDELKALIELVVVPESWMFRDPEAFAAVSRFVRERLTQEPTRLVRILSIPCAGGEEPYSIAMALQDAGVPRSATLIEAIDLSEVAIARARRGRYTKNAFRSADLAFRDRHFTPDGLDYQISQGLREQVNFSQGNLVALDPSANAGRYDIVFCRNLLIYFDAATTASAIAKLRLLLADDGILFAGYAEVPAFCSNGFAALRMPGAFALQKEGRAAPRVADPVAPARPKAVRARAAPPAASPAPKKPPAPIAPADPAQLLAQAARLADQGDYSGAAGACHAALVLQPNAAEAYFILGMVSECQNKSGEAGHYWRRCVYLQPDHYEALCHLSLLAEQGGNAALAATLKQRAARVYQRRDEGTTRKQAR